MCFKSDESTHNWNEVSIGTHLVREVRHMFFADPVQLAVTSDMPACQTRTVTLIRSVIVSSSHARQRETGRPYLLGVQLRSGACSRLYFSSRAL